jgi:pyruvate,orthophosphate dikinase
MDGLPVTIRTLDPPLTSSCRAPTPSSVPGDKLACLPRRRDKIVQFRDANPMLGMRGCRLAYMFPEITAMQVRAIMQAACKVAKEGKKVFPEIMIPPGGPYQRVPPAEGHRP